MPSPRKTSESESPRKTRGSARSPKVPSRDEATEETESSQDESFSEHLDLNRSGSSPRTPTTRSRVSKTAAKSEKSPPTTRTPPSRASPRQPIGKDEKDSAKKDSYSELLKEHSFLMAAMCMIILAVGLYYIDISHIVHGTQQHENNNSSDPLARIREEFKNEFSELQQRFTAQNRDFWKKIKIPVLRVIKEKEPEYPAVLLLVVPKGESTSQTATCLAKIYRSKLSKLYRGSENINEAYIDAKNLFSSESPSVENIKYELDNKIKGVLDNNNIELPTLVIDHIEALDPNVMLLFHGYCDGDYAPHKKAMILFVLHTDRDSEDISRNLDRTVDDLLQSLWQKNLDADKIPPLIARIANNKALIQEEKMSSLINC